MEPTPQPIPRKMNFPFRDSQIPRHWFFDQPFPTHLANGLNLLFPWGERFFVRSVRHYQDHIRDPDLRERVRGFFGQEGLHAREHERFFEILESQGYEVRRWLAWYERTAGAVEKGLMFPKLALAATAASEHFTATFAERALREDFLDHAHPVVRDLLKWHASEEIEHKSVAFDVLLEVDPSYALRIAGLAMATVLLSGFWFSATRMLLEQEDPETRAAIWAGLKDATNRRQAFDGTMWRALKVYAQPGFHPSQIPNDDLARAYLESIGRAAA